MDQGVSGQDVLRALELRVLDGPQAGARAPLGPGLSCVIAIDATGAGNGADIVLRDDAAGSTRVRVVVDVPNAALEVVEGDVRLGERALAAGEQAAWPMYVPLQIGRSRIAFGRAALEDWQAAAPQALATREAASAVAQMPTRRPLFRRAEVWLAAMGAGVLMLSGAALFTAHLSAAPRAQVAAPAPSFAEALAASEFASLQPALHADGRIELRGRLETVAQRTRLDTWLADQRVTPQLAVQVDEALARDVTEVFRVNGVTVQAKVEGAGHIAAEAAERNAERLARAEEVVRRDVRGLKKLTVRNTVEPLPPPPPPIPDDPGKRIASLVPGERGYLVTADGARYFVGALLPTGHRITQIAAGSVTVERDGYRSTLNF